MLLPPEKYYTVEDFYRLPEDIRAELINGQLVYMASPSRLHQELLLNSYSFHDAIKVGIFDDLLIDFSTLDLGN